MSAKTQTYSELAKKTSKELTHSENDWCMFLKSQAKLYKYNYADQLMIYAQRPDASLCLDFDAWTKTMNRYVHKGAKGIGLVDNSGDEPKMKYVFDISDTSEKFKSKPLHVWDINPDAISDICQTISDFYGFSKTEKLDEAVIKACRTEARHYAQGYMKDFDYILADSFLEEYDEDNRYKALYSIAKNSIAYVAFERCGIDPEQWFNQEDFMGVFEFNTPEVINFLGTCVSECSENVLRLVERAEKNFERNKANDLHNERQPDVSEPDLEQSAVFNILKPDGKKSTKWISTGFSAPKEKRKRILSEAHKMCNDDSSNSSAEVQDLKDDFKKWLLSKGEKENTADYIIKSFSDVSNYAIENKIIAVPLMKITELKIYNNAVNKIQGYKFFRV